MGDPSDQVVEVASNGPFATVSFNRPEVRNAFDGRTLEELAAVFRSFAPGEGPRAVFLTGAGDVFSSGADLKWMRDSGKRGDGGASYRFSSMLLSAAIRAVAECPLPTVALVRRAAFGGAVGFVAACDFAIASDDAVFRTTEVRIGVAPAVIAPFVLRKVGDRACREMFLTAGPLDAARALGLGLVDRVCPAAELAAQGENLCRQFLDAAPGALAACKELLRTLPGMDPEDAEEFTVRMISRLRSSEEGQEGMSAFLEKRKPGWAP